MPYSNGGWALRAHPPREVVHVWDGMPAVLPIQGAIVATVFLVIAFVKVFTGTEGEWQVTTRSIKGTSPTSKTTTHPSGARRGRLADVRALVLACCRRRRRLSVMFRETVMDRVACPQRTRAAGPLASHAPGLASRCSRLPNDEVSSCGGGGGARNGGCVKSDTVQLRVIRGGTRSK